MQAYMDQRQQQLKLMKEKVLGSLTDEAPGPEVGEQRMQLCLLSPKISRAADLMQVLKGGLDNLQQFWGDNFGQEDGPNNQRSLKEWCQRLKELIQQLEDWDDQIAAGTLEFTEAFYHDLLNVRGVALLSKMQWNDQQRRWGGRFGMHWTTPRPTLSQWCDDILQMIENHDQWVAERDGIRSSLKEMGWCWRMDRWQPWQMPVWKQLYNDLFTPLEPTPAATHLAEVISSYFSGGCDDIDSDEE